MAKAQRRTGTFQLTKSVRLFLVDDHPLTRQGWVHVLGDQNGFEIVGEAAGAPEALSGIRDAQPDLVITDLTLAEGGGIELVKDVRSQWPNIKVLVASMHNDAIYAERALRAGACGYVIKDQPGEQLMEAIGTVMRDRIYICPDLSDSLLNRALHNDGFNKDPVESLSDRELQVFEFLGDGLSTREIAEKLFLSVKTIETYRDNIKNKLSLENSNELVHRAVRWKLDRGSA